MNNKEAILVVAKIATVTVIIHMGIVLAKLMFFITMGCEL